MIANSDFCFMQTVAFYQQAIKEYLSQYNLDKEPASLYNPIQYILTLGGKRLRPVLTLVTAEIFDTSYKKALDAALSIELFHNFSLIHDDIMDDAPLRRGKQTVHEKWDINTGILSGDAMLILAYQLFEDYQAETFKALVKLFSKTALEVCEGQQYDMCFETRDDVTIPEYLKMIEYKTAVLLGAAMKMGAIVAGVSKQEQDSIYNFGKYLGVAFQIQDDYLDAFGDPKSFGKQVGGDIIENKKTFLYLKALELGGTEELIQLKQLYEISPKDSSEKVETIKQIFISSGAADRTKKEIENYTHKAFKLLDNLTISEEKKQILIGFGKNLMNRKV